MPSRMAEPRSAQGCQPFIPDWGMHKITHGLVDVLLNNPKANTTSGISLRSRAVTELHSFLALSESGVIFPLTFHNASSVDYLKSSLLRDQDIKDLISRSHYYD